MRDDGNPFQLADSRTRGGGCIFIFPIMYCLYRTIDDVWIDHVSPSYRRNCVFPYVVEEDTASSDSAV